MLSTSWHNRHNLNYRLRTKFQRKQKTLEKKIPDITPFSIKTKNLAIHWWGKAWNAHLKNYTFNSIRLEKGKLNFRCEALADLKITSNFIEAIVLGSKIQPYEVTISIKPISETKWTKIQKLYDGHLELFEKILDHHLPKEMSELYSNKAIGLFPTPKEIAFQCSCSDRANICKHTSVVLYALGAKMDLDFNVLFKLRGVDVHDLVSKSIHSERKNILKKAKNKSKNILKDTDLSKLFKIEIQQK